MDKIKINSQDIYKLDGIDKYTCDNSVDISGFFSKYLKDIKSESATDREVRQRLDGESKVIFFVGYRNTGKTEYLKRYFNIKNNTPYIQNQGSKLIIPVLNNGIIEGRLTCETVYDNIRAACEKILSDYPGAEKFYKDEEIEKFYQFVIDTQIAALPELSFKEECSMTDMERKKHEFLKCRKKKN